MRCESAVSLPSARPWRADPADELDVRVIDDVVYI
jgi:hypothetical protein